MIVDPFEAKLRVAGAWICVAGMAVFAATCLALHTLRPELSPSEVAISYYIHGAYGELLTVGLFALGGGSLALSGTLWLSRTPSRTALICLILWSVGVLLGASFSADPPGHWDRPPSVEGSVHGIAALIAFLAFPTGAILCSCQLRSLYFGPGFASSLTGLAVASALSLIAFAVSLLPVMISPGPPKLLGLTERILLAIYVAWLTVAAVAFLRQPTRVSAAELTR